ncbi:hypothetical protein GCM10023086_36240 [Streptomyces venetus]|uniref:Uncharacterized protein n=1 Tax=Streptomyces venetus TaxID=1701086 RepID=A0ABP8G0F1_9ACTN
MLKWSRVGSPTGRAARRTSKPVLGGLDKASNEPFFAEDFIPPTLGIDPCVKVNPFRR